MCYNRFNSEAIDKMKFRKFAAFAVALCILLGGCTIENELGHGEASYEDFRAYIDERRAVDFVAVDLSPLAEKYRCSDEFETRSDDELRFELSRTTSQKSTVSRVTKSEAMSDIDFLLRMLREDYGAYEFFGGDEAFDAMKQRLEASVDEAFGGEARLPVIDFTALISDALGGTISDRSFVVRDEPVTPNDRLYQVRNEYFTREGDDFYYHGSKVLSVDGGDPHDYIKPTVAPNGAIVYSMWRSFPSDFDPTAAFIAAELEDTEPANFRWSSAYIDSFSNYSFGESFREGSSTSPDGSVTVPVVASSDLGRAGERFVESANRPSDEKALVLDLRVSGGSDETYIRRWLETYAGAASEVNELRLHRSSPMSNAIFESDEPFGTVASSSEGKNVELDDGRTLIVLVGGNTGAAETAQQLASRISNVITIGGISGGAALTADPTTRYLPSSGIRLTFGTTLRLSTGMFDENGGTCLHPDLYANPADALVFAREMVAYYGLNG